MSLSKSDVCVLLPTLNEGRTIGEVITGFQNHGFTRILVVDGDSTDNTREIAEQHGARVITQTGSGKGLAVRDAIQETTAKYILMADGDGTYRPEDAEKMLEPLANGYQHVIGDRYANMDSGAMPMLNRFGNWVFNTSFRALHRKDYQDILSGYRAFTRESVEQFELNADGFGIETELAVECSRHAIRTKVVPITYQERPGESNLHPVWDGWVIFKTLYGLARKNNPLFFFGGAGILCWVSALPITGFILYDWVQNHIGHEALTVVVSFLFLFGMQLLMFGYAVDLIVQLHEEQRTLIQNQN